MRVVVRWWNRLPKEVVDAPPLEVLQVRLDGALSRLILVKDERSIGLNGLCESVILYRGGGTE